MKIYFNHEKLSEIHRLLVIFTLFFQKFLKTLKTFGFHNLPSTNFLRHMYGVIILNIKILATFCDNTFKNRKVK